MEIILASASPRRMQILKNAGFDFEVIVCNKEECSKSHSPSSIVQDLSYQKATTVYQTHQRDNLLVIGADTLVAYKDEILGKPEDALEAYNMLSLLSNRTHQVYTGVTLIWNKNHVHKELTFYEVTQVTLYPIDSFDLNAYIRTGDSLDKAGGYGIQGMFSKHIKSITGDYNNVVGLPIGRLYHELVKSKVL